MKSNRRHYSNTDAIIRNPPETHTGRGFKLTHIKTPEANLGRTADPRRYQSQDTIVETYGPCIRFNRCRNIGELGDGLCVNCWDGTNSSDTYKRGSIADEQDRRE